MGRCYKDRSFNGTEVFSDTVVMSFGVDAEFAEALDRERNAEVIVQYGV